MWPDRVRPLADPPPAPSGRCAPAPGHRVGAVERREGAGRAGHPPGAAVAATTLGQCGGGRASRVVARGGVSPGAGATWGLRRGGGAAAETMPPSTRLDVPVWCPERSRSRRAARLRLVSVGRQGWGAWWVALRRQEPCSTGPVVPEAWHAVPSWEEDAHEPQQAMPQDAGGRRRAPLWLLVYKHRPINGLEKNLPLKARALGGSGSLGWMWSGMPLVWDAGRCGFSWDVAIMVVCRSPPVLGVPTRTRRLTLAVTCTGACTHCAAPQTFFPGVRSTVL